MEGVEQLVPADRGSGPERTHPGSRPGRRAFPCPWGRVQVLLVLEGRGRRSCPHGIASIAEPPAGPSSQ